MGFCAMAHPPKYNNLVVLKVPHPFRPVFGQHSTCFCPRSTRVRSTIPFQRPKLLETNSPDRPIHKQTIDVTIVPIYAEVILSPQWLESWRRHVIIMTALERYTIKNHWFVSQSSVMIRIIILFVQISIYSIASYKTWGRAYNFPCLKD